MRKNETGFGVVELFLILVIVGLVGFVGWYVWRAQNDATNNSAQISQATNNTASAANWTGWKAGTLTYEKIKYKYPAKWTIVDASEETIGESCVTPGNDDVTLTSPDKHSISLRTGVSCRGDGDIKVFESIPIRSLGQSLYINLIAYYDGSDEADRPLQPTDACLMPSSDAKNIGELSTKNIYLYGTDNKEFAENHFCFELSHYDGNVSMSTTQMKALPDFKVAKQLFESMAY